MGSFILHPTDTAQWQALVHEAQSARSLILGDELESYLVFMLIRFSTQPEIAKSILATEFLEGLESLGQKKHDLLRNLGDKCLLFSGFFPGVAEHRHVKISYFVNLGQSAYHTLSDLVPKDTKLFERLCEGFVSLMDVLQTMKSLSKDQTLLSPLEATELWLDTKSQHALDTLRRYTKSTPIS
ncbi:MAG: hypothetical protein JSS53_01120 [Proteobacteria bacterium]|nr:hypothetical protein [Pseudomonadota bacterium]